VHVNANVLLSCLQLVGLGKKKNYVRSSFGNSDLNITTVNCVYENWLRSGEEYRHIYTKTPQLTERYSHESRRIMWKNENIYWLKHTVNVAIFFSSFCFYYYYPNNKKIAVKATVLNNVRINHEATLATIRFLHSQPDMTLNFKLHFGTYSRTSLFPNENLSASPWVIAFVALWAPWWGVKYVKNFPTLRHVPQEQNVHQYYYLHCKLDRITDIPGFI
jgi:hypothetical protein